MYPITQKTEIAEITEDLVPMRDGVRLYTRVVAPIGMEKCPIVFVRTPYESAHKGKPHVIDSANAPEYHESEFVKAGFALVIQHIRGTNDSEGECHPYTNEKNDGLDTLDYIRSLPIYDGEIYPVGGSYLTAVHYSYFKTKPEDIKSAYLSIMTDRMFFRNHKNGCCYQFCNPFWYAGTMRNKYPNIVTDKKITHVRPYKDIFKRVVGENVAAYTNTIMNIEYNEYWKGRDEDSVAEHLYFPILFSDGWYDYYLDGMFSVWERLPKETRDKSALIVGPWAHCSFVGKNSEYPLPNGDREPIFGLEWLKCIHEGKPYTKAPLGKVTYYSIGSGEWRTGEFPRHNTEKRRFYFGKGGKMTDYPCNDDTSLSYKYNPDEPINYFKFLCIYKAPKINTCESVLNFETDEFEKTESFFGRIRWKMDVSSDCEDTVFFIRFSMVEDGEAYNLTETITSLSHINKNYVPGEKLTIDTYTQPIAFTIKPGCKIRVDIASDSDVYAPHANVRGHWAEVTETKIANNTVHLKDAFVEFEVE